MRDLAWDREDQAHRVRSQIWRYVTPANSRVESVLPLAAALVQLPRRDLHFLAALHLLISPEAGRLIEAAPTLLRQLTTSTTTPLDEHPDRIAGPVDWAATLALSATRGRRSYATRRSTRDYDTPENRLLFASLSTVADAAVTLGWNPTEAGVGVEVRERATAAAKLARVPLLRHDIRWPRPQDARRVERGRAASRFSTVSVFWRLADRLQRLEDPHLLREMVESTALLTTSDGALLELLVLFDTLDYVQSHGWIPETFGLVRGQVRLTHRRGDETLTVHYQAAPPLLPNRYGQVLTEHGLPTGPLRPDLVLDRELAGHRRRVAVVEVKYRPRAADAARSALLDLLAYRQVYQDPMVDLSLIGVGWGAELQPHTGSEFMLCTPDNVGTTLGAIVV